MTDALEIVKRIIDEKKKNNKAPLHATMREVVSALEKEARAELNAHYRSGEIEVGETINDKYIKIKDGAE